MALYEFWKSKNQKRLLYPRKFRQKHHDDQKQMCSLTEKLGGNTLKKNWAKKTWIIITESSTFLIDCPITQWARISKGVSNT